MRRFKGMMSIEDADGDDGDGDAAADVPLGDLEALQGVVKFPVRIKCATLAWNTLLDALDQPQIGLSAGVPRARRSPKPGPAPAGRSATSGTRSSATSADAELIERGRRHARRADDRLDDGPADRVREPTPSAGTTPSPTAGAMSPATTSARSPAARRRGGSTSRCTATATRSRPCSRCGAAHEGAPGRSHGGIVAGLFDDVFGFVLDVIQEAAFTGELTIRYEAPTPLHRPIACRGRLARRDGRKLHIEGELVDVETDGQPVVARGRGLFIAVDPAIFDRGDPAAPRPARRGR